MDRGVDESRAFTPVLPPRSISYADEEPESDRATTTASLYDTSHYENGYPPVGPQVSLINLTRLIVESTHHFASKKNIISKIFIYMIVSGFLNVFLKFR